MTTEQLELLRTYIDQKAYEEVDAALSYRDSIEVNPVKSSATWEKFVAALAAEGE